MKGIPFRAGDDDEPVDLAQVRADDALIEALRQTPLFDDPATDSFVRSRSADDDDSGDLDYDTGPDSFAAFARLAEDAFDGVDTGPLADVATDARVAALLQAWRSEIESVPLPPPIDTQIATAIVRAAPSRRRSVRPMIAVAAAIAALLMGSTAIGARSATPDDTLLWPVTQLLWQDRVEEVNASIEARTGIDSAAKAVDAGHPEQAEAALDRVTEVITKVQNPSESETLRSDFVRVQSQIESSMATAPEKSTSSTVLPVPGAGGVTTGTPVAPTVAPSSVPPTVTTGPSVTDPGTASVVPTTSVDVTTPQPIPPVPTDTPTTSSSTATSSTDVDTPTATATPTGDPAPTDLPTPAVTDPVPVN